MDFLRTQSGTAQYAKRIDQGMRSYMISIYNYMTIALVITGALAFFVGTSAVLSNLVFNTGLIWLFMLAPFALALYFSMRINSLSVPSAKIIFYCYSALMGISLGSIFLIYTGESITKVFFITAATFGGMSIYGYTTKKDLTTWGSFLFMGLLGLVITSLVNLFLQSSALSFITSLAGVIIFTGLVAYDTQRIKEFYYSAPDENSASKMAIFGALNLYMDFINLFLHLLRLLGDRK